MGYDPIMDYLDRQVDPASLEKLLDPSASLSAVWAKTDMRDPSDLRWLALPQHAADTMLVAGKIWDEFLAVHVKTLLAEAFGGEDDARRVTMFLAGCHDVGKATPAFEKQARGETGERRLAELEAVGLTIDPETVSSSLRHETAGFNAIRDWLVDRAGVDRRTASRMAIAVGGHHGIYHPNDVYNKNPNALRREYGDDSWGTIRHALLDRVDSCLKASQAIARVKWPELSQPLQSVLTGVIVMADWIASSLPLTANGLVDAAEAQARVDSRWRDLDLPEPWRTVSKTIRFKDMFSLPDGAEPRPLQAEASKLASMEDGPFIMIMEAPMGVGKTEAALLAAYECAKANGSGGIVFALPTRATANAILPRMVGWMDNVLDKQASLRLLHGTAALNDSYRKLVEASSAQLYGEKPMSAARINSWFNGRRQGLLASFVVCTIDQILMAALQAKHFDLKHLGLAGKTVIIDEVHAADEYMAVYLDRALEWLGAMRCPVILLSATLPSGRRDAMLESYMRGLRKLSLKKPDTREELPSTNPQRLDYPLVTVGDERGVHFHPVDGDSTDVEIRLEWTGGDGLDVVLGRISSGGCGAIIKNTVKGAQAVYKEAMESGVLEPDEIILVHSRFLPADRAGKEQKILSALGKHATLENGERPKRLLVIGTQVLEQSLDIDFDVMYSDVAPVDLLLQRAGRLHRHDRRTRPAGLEKPTLVIGDSTAVSPGEAPKFGGGSKAVYGGWRLMRTCAALIGRTTISLPSDIAGLVDSVYGDEDSVIPAGWSDAYGKAKDKHDEQRVDKENRASAFRLREPYPGKVIWGANERTKDMDEERGLAQVRDSDGSGLDVILLKRAGDDHAQLLVDDEQYGGTLIPLDQAPDSGTAIKLLEQKIGLPGELSGRYVINETIRWAEGHCLVPGWQNDPWLKGEFVLLLDGPEGNIVELTKNGKPYRVTVDYDRDIGLTCSRMERSD